MYTPTVPLKNKKQRTGLKFKIKNPPNNLLVYVYGLSKWAFVICCYTREAPICMCCMLLHWCVASHLFHTLGAGNCVCGKNTETMHMQACWGRTIRAKIWGTRGHRYRMWFFRGRIRGQLEQEKLVFFTNICFGVSLHLLLEMLLEPTFALKM